MKSIRSVATLFALLFMLASCEKEVHISLPESDQQLVVNGYIEKDGPPIVVLTHSIGFFAKIDLSTLANSFVHGAQITVSNGTESHQLREYTFDSAGYKLSVYTLDTSDPGLLSFRGQQEKFYKLSINVNGQLYESTTKIPATKAIDSLIADKPIIAPDKAPTARQLFVYYTDPDTIGNNVRFFTNVNSRGYSPGLNSVLDDQAINGSKDFRFPIGAGDDRQGTTSRSDSSGYVFPGDTVTLKWCAIDRGVYNFYNTLEYSLGTVGNPFSSPINVKSNISNGALGIWAGYGISYSTIIVK